MSAIQLVKCQFERSMATYDAHAQAQKKIASKLAEMVHRTLPDRPRRVLEVGCGTGLLTRQLNAVYRPDQYFLNDINAKVKEILPTLMRDRPYTFLYGDAQQICLPNELDLVVSASSLQWISDLAGFLAKVRQVLSKGGHLFFSSFGPSNLKEIAAIEHRGLDYHGLNEVRALLQADFDVLFCSEEEMVLRFDEPLAVLRHLKYTGVNGGFSSVWSRSRLQRFCEAYRAGFGDAQGVSLTYHPTYFAVRGQ
ncbi:malonyl-ACP O-methyltransferase BioC [Saezia sanguinis]|uniref:malonyl-ACP O-methyltransferase BioC n=1 Tax=Saezia sanguinis TaxID=1965230 RepID=UPI003057E437